MKRTISIILFTAYSFLTFSQTVTTRHLQLGTYCNSNDNDIFETTLKGYGTDDFVMFSIWKIESNGSKTKIQDISDVYISLGSGTNVFTMEIANNGIKNTKNGQSAPTINWINPPYNRPEGIYAIRGEIYRNNGMTLIMSELGSVTIYEGRAPEFKIVGPNENWSSTEIASSYSILKGCVNNDPRIVLDPNHCGSDGFFLYVQETDKNGTQALGNKVERNLTTSERSGLISGTSSFPINGFTDNTNTINITTGKYYKVGLTYNGAGQWKSNFKVFHYKEGTWDLVLKNKSNDKGYEPINQWDDDVFNAPSIWNKKSTTTSQNTKVHENPTFASLPNNKNKFFVEIHNIGCEPSPANQSLRAYWTIARTDELYSEHWTNNANNILNINSNSVLGGCEITITDPKDKSSASNPFQIPAVAAKGSYKIPWASGLDWYPPNPQLYKDVSLGGNAINGRPSFCLLARINEKNSANDPIIFEPTGVTDKILTYVKENNNVSTLNTTLYDDPGFFVLGGSGNHHHFGDAITQVNNSSNINRPKNLCYELVELFPNQSFLNYGNIEVRINTSLFNIWQSSGSQSENMNLMSTNRFSVTSDKRFCLKNLNLPSNYTSGQIAIRFISNHLLPRPSSDEQFRYQIVQTDLISQESESNSNFLFNVPNVLILPPANGSEWLYSNSESSGGFGSQGLAPKSTQNNNTVISEDILVTKTLGDEIQIDLEKNTGLQCTNLSLFDITGKLIVLQKNFKLPFTVQSNKLSSGLYILNLEIEGKHFTTKISH